MEGMKANQGAMKLHVSNVLMHRLRPETRCFPVIYAQLHDFAYWVWDEGLPSSRYVVGVGVNNAQTANKDKGTTKHKNN